MPKLTPEEIEARISCLREFVSRVEDVEYVRLGPLPDYLEEHEGPGHRITQAHEKEASVNELALRASEYAASVGVPIDPDLACIETAMVRARTAMAIGEYGALKDGRRARKEIRLPAPGESTAPTIRAVWNSWSIQARLWVLGVGFAILAGICELYRASMTLLGR
jgi:hypothetical protein